ncbi:MAG: hypothetical protein KAJ72_05015 [Candidatus Heimdallarchaeota archaeon]|nr:hypothetical protein [Candidatus Heimdallarchaeota archaeon]MCK5410037.1 hypothetical protein [Candidatus Heimdallarchaeota archaeon]
MSVLSLNKEKQQYFFTSEIEVNQEPNDFPGLFTRYDLELRELETQAREFQKLAARLFYEGYFLSSKEVFRRRENIAIRMSELRSILTN